MQAHLTLAQISDVATLVITGLLAGACLGWALRGYFLRRSTQAR